MHHPTHFGVYQIFSVSWDIFTTVNAQHTTDMIFFCKSWMLWYNQTMGKIDEIKEELNYLKVWLGIIVITTIGLIGWLINNYEVSSKLKTGSDMVAIIVLTISIIVIDKNIKKKIKSLRDL